MTPPRPPRPSDTAVLMGQTTHVSGNEWIRMTSGQRIRLKTKMYRTLSRAAEEKGFELPAYLPEVQELPNEYHRRMELVLEVWAEPK